MKYLVTGGAGFIGSHLVRALLEGGHEVVVVDTLVGKGSAERLSDCATRITLQKHDCADVAWLAQQAQGAAAIFHLAAIPSVPFSIEHPLEAEHSNLTSVLSSLEAARLAGVPRVVFSSSAAVYGDSGQPVQHEDDKLSPLSPYAVHKLAGEAYAQMYARTRGVSTVCLRYFNIFGDAQDPQSDYAAVIPKFIAAMLAGEQPVIFGDGNATRDFCHVDNVVHANMLAVTQPVERVSDAVVNIGSGRATTINELVDVLNTVMGKNIEPLHVDPRLGDILHSVADISRAKKLLGYEVKTDFSEGLRKTVEWYKV